MFCAKCGTQMKDTAKFCIKCGAPTGAKAAPPPKKKTAAPPVKAAADKNGGHKDTKTNADRARTRATVWSILVIVLLLASEAVVFFTVDIEVLVYKLAVAVCLFIIAGAALIIISIKSKDARRAAEAQAPARVAYAPYAGVAARVPNVPPVEFMDKTEVLDADRPLNFERPYNIHITLSGEETVRRCDRFPCVIGRQSDIVDFVISDRSVSRKHALLERKNGLVITSLSESNGVLINGNKISEPVAITSEDVVTLGRAVLKFEVL